MIAYENCYKNWLVWGFWMDQLLHVNIFKTQATLIVNDGENTEVFESSTLTGFRVISILVDSVINQMILSDFKFESDGFESKLQFEDSNMNDFFKSGNDDCGIYFQNKVVEIFLEKKLSEYFIKLSFGDIEYIEKDNFRSFSKNFELDVHKNKIMINVYLEILRHLGSSNAQVIVCRAKMVNKYSSSLCTIS